MCPGGVTPKGVQRRIFAKRRRPAIGFRGGAGIGRTVVAQLGPAIMSTWHSGPQHTTSEEWFESRQVRIGEEVGWHGGAVRLRFDSFEVTRPGLIARLLDGQVASARVRVHLTTPTQGTWQAVFHANGDQVSRSKLGPYGQAKAIFQARCGVVFELCRMIDKSTALVRTGIVPMPSGIETHGNLAALDDEARSFIGSWLERDEPLGESIPKPQEPLELIEGFSVTLAMVSGSPGFRFYRSTGRYFILSCGGCFPVDTWYGPFVSSSQGWSLQPLR
jgi:hypothetical protein